MQVGYGDDWRILLFIPALLWLPLGPFIMGTLGAWYARKPGRGPRLGRFCCRWSRRGPHSSH